MSALTAEQIDKYRSIGINVRNSFITRDINGEEIRITSAKEEEKLCSEFKVARVDDYKETFKKSREEILNRKTNLKDSNFVDDPVNDERFNHVFRRNN